MDRAVVIATPVVSAMPMAAGPVASTSVRALRMTYTVVAGCHRKNFKLLTKKQFSHDRCMLTQEVVSLFIDHGCR